MPPRRRTGRKILIASIGVATLNYVGVSCGGDITIPGRGIVFGNLVPPPVGDAAADQQTGDVAPPPETGGHDAIEDGPVANLAVRPDAIDDVPVANLVAPPDAVEESPVAPRDAFDDFPVANLVAPPIDSGIDAGR
jgi:hypothetical protein